MKTLSCPYSILPATLLCTAIVLTACQEAEAVMDERDDAAAQNEELAERYIKAYNAQDLETLTEILADPMMLNDEEEDLEAFLNVLEGYWGSFPDITLEPTHIVGADDHVTIRMVVSATGEDEFVGYDIDGREIHATETILFGVRDGEFAEYWYNWDELAFWQQLGVLESPYPEE